MEKKQIEEAYAGKLQEVEKKASFFETLYRDSTIERALQDAAVKHEAWSPSQIVTLLRGQTKMLEETDPKTGKLTGKYKPMVEMQTLNATTGEMETKAYTPEDAVKKMKDDARHLGQPLQVRRGLGHRCGNGYRRPHAGSRRQDGCGGDQVDAGAVPRDSGQAP